MSMCACAVLHCSKTPPSSATTKKVTGQTLIFSWLFFKTLQQMLVLKEILYKNFLPFLQLRYLCFPLATQSYPRVWVAEGEELRRAQEGVIVLWM